MTPEVQSGRQIDLRRGIGSLCEQFVKRLKHGEKVWNAGLGEVVNQAIAESDLPHATTPVELARKLGILPAVRRSKR
jgi:hypothetical protein